MASIPSRYLRIFVSYIVFYFRYDIFLLLRLLPIYRPIIAIITKLLDELEADKFRTVAIKDNEEGKIFTIIDRNIWRKNNNRYI